jgi:zinc D-Ala-D-Ala dipeptidase
MNREIDQKLLEPIPQKVRSVDGWKEVPIQENQEPLVPLGPFSENDAIFTSSIYAGEKSDSPYFKKPLQGSLITVFVRQSVAERLKVAQGLLPSGMRLVVLDAYRPLAVQHAAFDFYLDQLKEKHPDWEQNQLLAETQKYVSIPSIDPKKPSPHNTGGSVDAVILEFSEDIDKTITEIESKILSQDDWQKVYLLEMQKLHLLGLGQQLNFGTHFDWGGEEAALNYLEVLAIQKNLTDREVAALLNRRLLYNVMTQAGFLGYEHEW